MANSLEEANESKEEVFDALLGLYQTVSESWINECSWDSVEAEELLEEEVKEWKERYENAN